VFRNNLIGQQFATEGGDDDEGIQTQYSDVSLNLDQNKKRSDPNRKFINGDSSSGDAI